MSECKRKQFKFRQPVTVQVKGEWYPGAYLHYNESAGEHVAMWSEDGKTNGKINWFPCSQIDPDPYHRLAPVAEAAHTGWRLPEPGDVVRVKQPGVNHEEGVIKKWVHDKVNPIFVDFPEGGFATYQPKDLELVRLHDASEPFFKPGEDITASKINEALRLRPRPAKQDIIDNATLELAAVALEQHGQDRIAAMVRDLQRDWSEAS